MNNLNDTIRTCPVCKSNNTIVPVCDENGTFKNYALCEFDIDSQLINTKSSIPLKCDLCKNCGHIMLFHSKPEMLEYHNR